MPEEDLFKRVYALGRKWHPEWDEREVCRRSEPSAANQTPFSASDTRKVRGNAMEEFGGQLAKKCGILSLAGDCRNTLLGPITRTHIGEFV